jgi:hypothetical protein
MRLSESRSGARELGVKIFGANMAAGGRTSLSVSKIGLVGASRPHLEKVLGETRFGDLTDRTKRVAAARSFGRLDFASAEGEVLGARVQIPKVPTAEPI